MCVCVFFRSPPELHMTGSPTPFFPNHEPDMLCGDTCPEFSVEAWR